MKKKSLFILFVLSMWFGCMKVDASSSDSFFKITDEQSLIECFSKDNMCELSTDVTLSARQILSNNVILDLKGHTLTAGDDLSVHAGLLKVNHGTKLTIMDSAGNGKISTGKSKEVWAAIDLVDTTESDKPAELVVNGGTIEGYYYGITGNGDYHNTAITINGGTIKTLNAEDSVAIFQPQVGKLEVNGGTITGATGIEIRSGNLTVNGGTITGGAKEFSKMVNGNGTTTTGVGIAVAQHTTKNEINVVINNGNISGVYGLYEWNPHNNAEINKVKLLINNGDFKTTGGGGLAVYSENFTKFIKGGKFNTDVSDYTVEGAKTTMQPVEIKTQNLEEKKSSVWMYVVAIILIGAGAGSYTFYKVKKNH